MLHWTVHLKGAPKVYDDAVVSVGNDVYSFGGSSMFSMDQIHVNIFNTVTLLWTKLPPVTNRKGKRPRRVPSWRYGHTAVLIGDIVYVCGGFTYIEDFCKNRSYAFNVDTHRWFKPKVSGTVPKARSGHSACALGKVMYIYGGDTWTDWTNDIYKLDTATMVWTLIIPRGTLPLASAWHSVTVIGTKMFVFGGEGDEGNFNRVRVFDTEANSWLRTPSARLRPQGRRKYHSAFAYNGELYIFGGKKRKKSRCIWKFNPETFSWRKVSFKGKGPGNNWMCCCTVGDRVVLFGGYQGYSTVDDLYVLDLSPSLKTLCKLAVIQEGLDQSELPHNVRWELTAMTGKKHSGAKKKGKGKKRNRKYRQQQKNTRQGRSCRSPPDEVAYPGPSQSWDAAVRHEEAAGEIGCATDGETVPVCGASYGNK